MLGRLGVAGCEWVQAERVPSGLRGPTFLINVSIGRPKKLTLSYQEEHQTRAPRCHG